MLFTTPALSELRRALPDAHITYLIGPWFREIVARNPSLDEIQTCAFPGFRRETQGALEPYRLLWRLARELRRGRYDLAIVLRPDFWWGVWLIYLAGIPLRLGYAADLQTPFLTWALPLRAGEHAVRQNLRLVRAAALLAKDGSGSSTTTRKLSAEQVAQLDQLDNVAPVQGQPPLEFAPTDEERAWVQKRLAQADMSGRDRLVVIHPGTGAPVKLWGTTSWARVADALARAHGLRIVLTGSAGEREQVEGIRAQMRQPALTLIGETDVGRLAALLARADLALGVDNGPLHLATAQGTPTVRLYGPTDPRVFAPWGEPRLHKIVQAQQPCAGCAAIPCGRLDWSPEELPAHPCVRSLSVEEVLAAAEALLNQRMAKQEEKA
jgi:ADP-heptose:LPS heptosyltransferase